MWLRRLGKVAIRRERWQMRIRAFHCASDRILEARMRGGIKVERGLAGVNCVCQMAAGQRVRAAVCLLSIFSGK
jgi:hypothetical protein